jgi:Flp pilus assembly protein TadB
VLIRHQPADTSLAVWQASQMYKLDRKSKPEGPAQSLVVRPITIVAAAVAWGAIFAAGVFWHAIDLIYACLVALLFVGLVYWIVEQVRRGSRPE